MNVVRGTECPMYISEGCLLALEALFLGDTCIGSIEYMEKEIQELLHDPPSLEGIK